MALTLIKEDGTGLANANAYASAADGDAYHAGHLYATAWTGATGDQKAAALVMATRLIDGQYQFNGLRSQSGQALQWQNGLAILLADSWPFPLLHLKVCCRLASMNALWMKLNPLLHGYHPNLAALIYGVNFNNIFRSFGPLE
jgi:hypothetical protein